MNKERAPIRIVILGAGFAGIYAYLGLHKRFHGTGELKITLVSKHDYFLYVPLIHEVATGNLLPLSIVQSLRVLPQCCLNRFIEGHATSIDVERQVVSIKPQNPVSQKELPYDYLICALGSDTNFFSVPGAKEHCLTLKNLKDAAKIKNQIIDCFTHADEEIVSHKEQERMLRFVIVGGGPTGVEVAGEMADYIKDEMYQAFPRLRDRANILLIEGGERLVSQAEEWFHKKVRIILEKKMNVQVQFNTRVTKVTPEGMRLGKKWVASPTVIWTAGVRAAPLTVKAKKPLEYEEGTFRIKVNSYLQLPEYPNVLVIGDQAWIHDTQVGQPYPMRAQFAIQEGRVAAENIKRLLQKEPLQQFKWRDKGFLLSLGKGGALAKVFGIYWSGPFAWWMYRTGILFFIVGARAKLRTVFEWTLNLFFSRDVSKV